MTDRIVVGEDMRGNQIVYQNNHDGTWTNLLQEIVYPEDFILAHFSHLITEYHDQDHLSELEGGSRTTKRVSINC